MDDPDGHGAPSDAPADSSAPPTDMLVAVFDDFDPDYMSPPFDDRVTLLRYNLEGTSYAPAGQRSGFNTSQTVGGMRSIAASPDGRLIAVVDNANDTLQIFDTALTTVALLITGHEFSAVYLTNTRAYAVEGGTTSGTNLRVYELATGAEVAGSPSATLAGIEVVVDTARNVVWTAGTQLRRGDGTTLTGVSKAMYDFVAPSLDVAGDGSLWVVERASGGVEAGTVHHYSGAGDELPGDRRALTSSPFCVRVNRVTGDVWVAHSAGITRLDAGGRLHPVDGSGAFWSLAINANNGDVWAAGGLSNTVMNVYLPGGGMLSQATGFSASDTYVAVVH